MDFCEKEIKSSRNAAIVRLRANKLQGDISEGRRGEKGKVVDGQTKFLEYNFGKTGSSFNFCARRIGQYGISSGRTLIKPSPF